MSSENIDALELLRKSVSVFNAYRRHNPDKRLCLIRAKITFRLDCSGADFSNANLEGADFGGVHLVRACFNGANLREANMRYTILNGADFSNANLVGTQFAFCKGLPHTVFSRAMEELARTISFEP